MPETTAKRLYRARNGASVESALTLEEAIQLCSQRQDPFSNDLAATARRQKPTAQQEAWLHIKANQVLQWRAEEAKRDANAPVLNIVGIVRLLTKAKESGLKYPGIRIALDAYRVLKLTIATEHSRFPGSVSIKTDNCWIGRIKTDGTLSTRPAGAPDWMVDLLAEFAADPVAVAQRYGQLTDTCSFCGQALRDARSTKVGYGPTCAKRYGLPWGTEKTTIPTASIETPRDREVRYATGG